MSVMTGVSQFDAIHGLTKRTRPLTRPAPAGERAGHGPLGREWVPLALPSESV